MDVTLVNGAQTARSYLLDDGTTIGTNGAGQVTFEVTQTRDTLIQEWEASWHVKQQAYRAPMQRHLPYAPGGRQTPPRLQMKSIKGGEP